jgi:putative heme-binding domain-containing protein
MKYSITRRMAVLPLLLAAWTIARGQSAVDPVLPTVVPGLTVKLFAQESLVRNPAAMAFDRRGRLFVGQGPQYRNPTQETPGDSVVILIDSNGDGVADASRTFASGLNSIQGLAWHGRDLWIGNSPDLTVVRDLDGDDVADEYIKVYTDLGKVETPTTAAQVLPLLAAADATRGPGLFKAAGCAACHRAGDEGRAIAPDLSTIGDRDDADSIVRSILNPNQIIVEGYGLLTVSTRDGKAVAGVFESETDRTLMMVQLNGETAAIEKSTISSRRNIHESPIPPYDGVLNPRDVADLVTWLMRRSAATTGAAQTAQRAPASPGFAWELQPGRLSILHAGRRLTDYVFADPEILRPYFQNVRAPSGAQVTRTHPPAAGDANDHAAMHPGVWLAFGDVNGEDFWRNRARIEHEAFITEPSLVQGRLVFATRNRLVAWNATRLATLISRFGIAPWGDHAFAMTWEAEIQGEGRELVFGDQEEMGLGVRVATELTEQKGGLVVNSDGVTGAKTVWGKPAAWAAYSREIGGRIQGVAIFPSASNPSPTWWHSRDYGVIVANGFGKRALPESPDGKLVVKSGDSLKLRYDVLLFDSPSSAPIDFAAAYRRLQSDLSRAR